MRINAILNGDPRRIIRRGSVQERWTKWNWNLEEFARVAETNKLIFTIPAKEKTEHIIGVENAIVVLNG